MVIPTKMRLNNWAVISSVCLAAALLFEFFGFDQVVMRRVQDPLNFAVKNRVRRDALDDRIKVFAYDDRTVAKGRTFDIPLPVWADLLANIASFKPAAIMVDKLFDVPYSEAHVSKFVEKVGKLDVPIVIGTFVSQTPIGYREPLSPASGAYTDKVGSDELWPIYHGHYYGSDEAITKATKPGHILYDGDGRVRPLVRTGVALWAPHWTMRVVDWRIDEHSLLVNNRKVRLDRDYRMAVNFLPPSAYFDRAVSMLGPITDTLKNRPIQGIKAGDYVLILPAMYTGNTDWRETPVGTMPGGFVLTAMLDAILKNSIPDLVDVRFVATLLAVGSAALVVLLLPQSFLWGALIGGWVFILLIGLLAFSLFLVNFPYVLPSVIFLATGLVLTGERIRQEQIEQVRLQHEIHTAKVVQESFLPKSVDLPHLDFSVHYEPSSECGGDWWGRFAVTPECQYVLIADATGHGLPAALVTAMVFAGCEGFIRECRETGDRGPGALLRHLNNILASTHGDFTTMTMQAARFDLRTMNLTVANAAHPFPYRITTSADAKQTVGKITVPGDVLGLVTDCKIGERSVPINAGDKFVFYTDGLIENENRKGEGVSPRLLTNTVKDVSDKDHEALRTALVKMSEHHTHGVPPKDDTTVVVVRIRDTVAPTEKAS